MLIDDLDNLGLELKEIADPRTLDALNKIERKLSDLYAKNVPTKIQAEVVKQTPVSVANLAELESYFKSLELAIRNIKIPPPQVMPQVSQQPVKVDFPKINFPKAEKLDLAPLLDGISSLRESLGKGRADDSIGILRKINDNISELVNRPVMTPQPVTNININPLSGFAKSTQQTVTQNLSQIPDYGQLFDRRSLIIFNNSQSVTVYIGGSDVTSTTGMPILPQTYSPSIDAGYLMVIYGLTASSSADIRVLEVSRDQTGQSIEE